MSKAIEVGDRVKVEFEGDETQVYDGTYMLQTSADQDYGWFDAPKLTVIPKPIVLPTKRNALIELEGDIWLLGKDEWFSPDGASRWTPEGVANYLRTRPKANYRVIFAGEDDE